MSGVSVGLNLGRCGKKKKQTDEETKQTDELPPRKRSKAYHVYRRSEENMYMELAHGVLGSNLGPCVS